MPLKYIKSVTDKNGVYNGTCEQGFTAKYFKRVFKGVFVCPNMSLHFYFTGFRMRCYPNLALHLWDTTLWPQIVPSSEFQHFFI